MMPTFGIKHKSGIRCHITHMRVVSAHESRSGIVFTYGIMGGVYDYIVYIPHTGHCIHLYPDFLSLDSDTTVSLSAYLIVAFMMKGKSL